MSKPNPVAKGVFDFVLDVMSLPLLVITGPVVGNPSGTVALSLKLMKIFTTIMIVIILIICFFISTSQINEKLSSDINKISYSQQNNKVKSFLDTFKSSKQTVFSEDFYKFVENKAGIKTVAGSNPPVLEGECVSLVKLWQHNIGGGYEYWFGNYPIPAYSAYKNGLSSIAVPNSKYSLLTIENVENLQAGDLLIMLGFPSHTAVATGRLSDKNYEVFDENSPLRSPPTISEYSKGKFIGAIRYVKK
jgi:hypothetical protein